MVVVSMIVSNIYITNKHGLIDVIFCNYIHVIISYWREEQRYTNIYKYIIVWLLSIFWALGTILLSWVGFRDGMWWICDRPPIELMVLHTYNVDTTPYINYSIYIDLCKEQLVRYIQYIHNTSNIHCTWTMQMRWD